MVRLIAIVVLVLGVLGVDVFSSTSAAAREPARVITTIDCGILLPGILPDGHVLKTSGTIVITAGGTATMTCTGHLTDSALFPASTVIFTDIDCALGEGGQVAESLVIVRPTGRVTLSCQNNPGSDPFIPDEGD
jgi:hypothetical protein